MVFVRLLGVNRVNALSSLPARCFQQTCRPPPHSSQSGSFTPTDTLRSMSFHTTPGRKTIQEMGLLSQASWPLLLFQQQQQLLQPKRTRTQYHQYRSFATKKKNNKKEPVEPVVQPAYALDKLPHKGMYRPLPEKVQEHLEDILKFVTGTWLVKYPAGASGRKLQRDIAFRMKKGNPSRNEKLAPVVIDALIGELCRRQIVTIRNKGKSKGAGLSNLVLTKYVPREEEVEEEEMANENVPEEEENKDKDQ